LLLMCLIIWNQWTQYLQIITQLRKWKINFNTAIKNILIINHYRIIKLIIKLNELSIKLFIMDINKQKEEIKSMQQSIII
jgi:hypothetical protein